MLKCLVCFGVNTNKLLEQLEYNVNGIELIGCSDIHQLDSVIKKAGKLDSVVISESAIDKEDLTMPDVFKENSGLAVTFILNDRDVMQQLDIEFFGVDNVRIVDNKNQPMTLVKLKDIISSIQVDDYMLYHGDNITLEQDTPPVDEEPVVEEIEEETPIRTFSEEDESPVFDLGEERTFIETEDLQDTRELSLEQDTPVMPLGVASKPQTAAEKIKTSIKYHQDEVIILITGTKGSYASTTAYRIAKYISGLDFTTILVDLDTRYNSTSVITRKISLGIQDDNSLTKAMGSGDLLNNSYLVDTNFQICCNSQFADSLDLKSNIENIVRTIKSNKRIYNVMVISFPIEELDTVKPLVDMSDYLLFNVKLNNRGLLDLLRNIELLENDDLRDKVFTKSFYIQADPENKPLLSTKYKDITALDNFLADNNIINELKYADITCVGSIMKDDSIDSYGQEPKFNTKETEDILERLFIRK